jgi:hypothetical protein
MVRIHAAQLRRPHVIGGPGIRLARETERRRERLQKFAEFATQGLSSAVITSTGTGLSSALRDSPRVPTTTISCKFSVC